MTIYRGTGTSQSGVGVTLDEAYVNVSGDTMTGHLNVPSGGTGSNVPTRQDIDDTFATITETVKLTGNQTIAGVKTFSSPVGVAAAVASGDAVRYSQVLGLGQTWQDVTASRALTTTYNNGTGKPITVMVGVGATGAGTINVQATVGGVALALSQYTAAGSGYPQTTTLIVPIGADYSMLNAGVNSLNSWVELR